MAFVAFLSPSSWPRFSTDNALVRDDSVEVAMVIRWLVCDAPGCRTPVFDRIEFSAEVSAENPSSSVCIAVGSVALPALPLNLGIGIPDDTSSVVSPARAARVLLSLCNRTSFDLVDGFFIAIIFCNGGRGG